MVKANRYKSAGKSSAVSQDSEHMFFGPPHKQLMELNAAGQLPLSAACDASSDGVSMQAGGPAAAAADEAAADDAELELDAHVERQCHPRLSCARETSVNNSISDECGIAGIVCTHGQPLLGCMLAMTAPERFLFFDLLVSYLLGLVELQVLFLDTGCTFAAHWRLHMSEHQPPTHTKVPWWHGRGHGSECFLRNSGFYLPGELPAWRDTSASCRMQHGASERDCFVGAFSRRAHCTTTATFCLARAIGAGVLFCFLLTAAKVVRTACTFRTRFGAQSGREL